MLDFVPSDAYNNIMQKNTGTSARRFPNERKSIMSEMEYTPDILTLEDEDGNESAFEVLDTMELDGKTYVALTPYFEDPEEMLEGDAELVVLVSEEVDGEEFLASIDSDEEYERVGSIFLERLAEYDEEEDEE